MRTLFQAGPPMIQQLKRIASTEYAKGNIHLDSLGIISNQLDHVLDTIEQSKLPSMQQNQATKPHKPQSKSLTIK